MNRVSRASVAAQSPAHAEASAPTPIWISHRLQVALIVAAVVLLGLAVWRVPQIVTVIVAAGALALLLSFPVRWLSRMLPRGLAVLLTLVLVLIGFVLTLIYLVPLLIGQLSQLLGAWPGVEASLRHLVDDASQALRMRGLSPAEEANPSMRLQQELSDRGQEIAGNALTGLVGMVSGTLGAVVVFVAVLTIAIYLVLDVDKLRTAFISVAPERYRNDAAALWEAFGTSMTRYLGGVVVVAAVAGVTSGLALWMIGVPYPLPLGLWVAFTSLIPIFGTYLGIVPALPVAFAVSPTTGVQAILAYMIIQQVKDNILTPRVQGQSANVHPVLVLLTVLWAGWAYGVFWAVLAVPALVMARVLFDFLQVRVRVQPAPPSAP
jgi:predicted PurR-regulated permease PerM